MNDSTRSPGNWKNVMMRLGSFWSRIRHAFLSMVRRVRSYAQRGRFQRLVVILVGVVCATLVLGLIVALSYRSGGWLRIWWVRTEPELNAAIQDLFGNIPETGPGMIPRVTLVERFRLWIASRPFAEGLRWALLLIVPILVAYWLVAYYLETVFHLNNHRVSRTRLNRHILPIFHDTVTVKDGNLLPGESRAYFYRMGGPANLRIHPGNVAVVEAPNGAGRILEYGRSRIRLKLFERLRLILDLRSKSVVVNVEDRTQDGMMLAARQAKFRYHISRGRQVNSPRNGIDDSIVKQLVYHHWVGGDWENPEKPRQDITPLVESELRSYIARRRLVDFLAFLPHTGQHTDESTRHLNPFSQFAEDFSQNAGKYFDQGAPALFHFEWTGDGEWILQSDISLDEHTAEWLLTAQNALNAQPESLEKLRKESQQAEFMRLVEEALVESFQSIRTKPVKETKQNILVAYRRKFEAALQSGQDWDERVREDLRHVIEQLVRLAP